MRLNGKGRLVGKPEAGAAADENTAFASSQSRDSDRFDNSMMIGYLTLNINPKYAQFAMSLRPKLGVMLVTAVCIGGASIVFQTLIRQHDRDAVSFWE